MVVTTLEDLKKVEPGKKVILFSQTTMDPDRFSEVENSLKDHLTGIQGEQKESSFRSNCTICGQMKKRKPELASFVKKYDLILFVSGKNSSNGRMLYEFCKSINAVTYWISQINEIQLEWFEGISTIGISGATSTSRDQLESVLLEVKKLTSS